MLTCSMLTNLLEPDLATLKTQSKLVNVHVNQKSGYVQNETQVAQDFYTFLQNFFKTYPQYAGLNFYMTGERYVHRK